MSTPGARSSPGRDLLLLLVEALVEQRLLRAQPLGSLLERRVGLVGLHADLEPLVARQLVEIRLRDLGARGEPIRAARGHLADQRLLDALIDVVLEDALLIVEILAHGLELLPLDRQRAPVLLDAVAREHAHVDDGAVHAGRHAQARVLHVGRLLAEDRAQQLLFRRQLGLALRRDLTDEDVAGADFGADERDAALVELRERGVTDVRDVRRDFLGPELRVARDASQLLDVDRRETILDDHALRDQDRVLEVVAVPRHERDEQVLAERELAHARRRAVGQHVTLLDRVAGFDERPLIDAGVLVRARVLREVVDVDAGFAGLRLLVLDANDDARRVDGVDDAAAARDDRDARIDGHGALHARADERRLGAQRRDRLTLHVRAHQRAVRVVVLEERDQRRGDRDDLLRRDVHVLDLVGGQQRELVLMAARHEVFRELALRATVPHWPAR